MKRCVISNTYARKLLRNKKAWHQKPSKYQIERFWEEPMFELCLRTGAKLVRNYDGQVILHGYHYAGKDVDEYINNPAYS